MTSPFSSLHLTIATWDRKTEGLFDYHSRKVTQQEFTVAGAVKLMQRGDTCAVAPLAHATPGDCVSLLSIAESMGRYFVQAEDAWVVAGKGSTKWPGITIHAGDSIRFGRTAYRVLSLNTRHTATSQFDTTLISEGVDLESATPVRKSPGSCRICLSDEDSDDNALLSPCACDGSVKFIHFRCLQEWMKSKSDVKTKGCISRYILKQLRCELCKTVLPEKVYVKGRNVELTAFTHPEAPHLILEEETDVPDTASRTLYILSFPQGRLMRVGRGRECDIRIRDFAVSRVNSFIRLTNEQFILEDKNSKFGSLLLMSHPMPLSRLPVRFQVDRTVVTITAAGRGWLQTLLCCCRGNSAAVEDEREPEDAIKPKKARLETKVVPTELTESDLYGNIPNCVAN